MELRQLEYLVAVIDEGGFTKAARKLHVAQPGVSSQIRQLERELGQPLVDRSGRAVRPTEAGAAVLPHARAALQAVHGTRLAIDELAGLVRGRVAVGAVSSHNIDIPGLLAAYHHRHPGVEIALSEANSAELIERLRSGALDLALIGMTRTRPDGLDTRVLAAESLVAAVAPGDPLAAADEVCLSTLASRDLVCQARGTAARSALEEAWAQQHGTARVTFESGDPGTCARLAEHGLGVAVLQKSIVDNRAALHGIPIVRPALHGWLGLAWRAGGPVSPAARALLRLSRRLLPGPDD